MGMNVLFRTFYHLYLMEGTLKKSWARDTLHSKWHLSSNFKESETYNVLPNSEISQLKSNKLNIWITYVPLKKYHLMGLSK